MIASKGKCEHMLDSPYFGAECISQDPKNNVENPHGLQCLGEILRICDRDKISFREKNPQLKQLYSAWCSGGKFTLSKWDRFLHFEGDTETYLIVILEIVCMVLAFSRKISKWGRILQDTILIPLSKKFLSHLKPLRKSNYNKMIKKKKD